MLLSLLVEQDLFPLLHALESLSCHSRYKRIKKKGYIRIVTNKGPLNLELHCDAVPKTCENFVKLAQKGYYNGTIFHRSIKNFMIQGALWFATKMFVVDT